jgi:CAAX protease family protein
VERPQPPIRTPHGDLGPLAPAWHTAALVAVICAVAATGALLTSRGVGAGRAPDPTSRIAVVYLPMIVVQWSLALYVCRIGRPRNALPSLLGEGWNSIGRACTDIAIGLSGWLIIKAVELAWVGVFGSHGGTSVVAMLPHSPSERVAWVVVSVSVGFCEEIVYRGYLQSQLAAFTGRPTVAMALQAGLFGIAHGDQGSGAVARLALYGLALGMLARWRRSRVTGIVCHVWTDIASGLFRG